MQLIRAVLKAFLICQIARVRRDKSHVPDVFQSEALEERERTGREPQHVAPAAPFRWQDLPYELKAMILDQVIELIAGPSSEVEDYEDFCWGIVKDRFNANFDNMPERWLQLSHLVMAMPDQYDYICSNLDAYTHKAWHIRTRQIKAHVATYGEECLVPEYGELQLDEGVRQHLTYLALWTLVRLNAKGRDMIFWRAKDNMHLVVYRSRPFDIEYEIEV